MGPRRLADALLSTIATGEPAHPAQAAVTGRPEVPCAPAKEAARGGSESVG